MTVVQLAVITIQRIKKRPTKSHVSHREPTDTLLNKWFLKSCTA